MKGTDSLTLAAMSLGYGVVQLDVTIVNTALNSIGTRAPHSSQSLHTDHQSQTSLREA